MAARVFGEILLTLRDLSYSRRDEKWSDELAVEYCVMAGYPANSMVQVLEILQAAANGASRGPEFFATHPNTEDRIDNVLAYIDYYEPETEVAEARDGQVDFDSTISRMGDYNRAYFAADQAYYEEDPNRRAALISKSIDKLPDDGNLRAMRAAAYLEAGKPDQALADAKLASARPDSRYSGLLAQGSALTALGRTDEAERILLEAEEDWPKSGELHLGLAEAYRKAGKKDKAKEQYKVAFDLEPSGPLHDKAVAGLKKVK
jgi:predicted Zn-dependent protease